MKPIYCVVKILKLPMRHRTWLRHYDNHQAMYGLRAKTLPGGRESLLCITKPTSEEIQ